MTSFIHQNYIIMKILKKCLTCGADFIATKMSSKYCCRSCEHVAQRRREAEKRKLASEKLLEFGGSKIPSELENKQFLTPKNLQDLLGVSRATIYRYFEFGIIKAVRIRQRTLVRRSDLEAYFDTASPYKKRSNKRKADKEYYSLKEIMEKYNIGRKAVWNRCDRLGIPKVYEGRNTYWSKKAIDSKFADLLEEIDLENYYTMEEVMEIYNMSRQGVITFVCHHKVPRVKRGKSVYYSKIHIDSFKRKGAGPDPDWYTYEEITEKYGFTKDQIKYTLNHFEIRTEKRGKFTMIFRTDFDKAAAQRLAGAKRVERIDESDKVVLKPKVKEVVCPPTPDGYYSAEDVAAMFKCSLSHVWNLTRENKIVKITLNRFNFYEKQAIDELYNRKNHFADITDWITPAEMRTTYKMTKDATSAFIRRHNIPSKVEYGKTYYSKQHIDVIKTGYFEDRDRYYSVQEAMSKFNLTKDLVFYYASHYKITKVKNGQFVFFRKEEFNRIIKERRNLDPMNLPNIDSL